MQSFFISFSDLIDTIWQWIKDFIDYFHVLFDYLNDSIVFVLKCLSKLPDIVRVPATVVLGIMVIKFILSLGKQ